MKENRQTKYTEIFTRDDEDGGWVAQGAEVPSAITQGETLAEAKRNLREAIEVMVQLEADSQTGFASPSR